MKTVSGKLSRKTTTPLNVPKTRRHHRLRCMTSLKAGKAIPLAVIPLLRHDAASVACSMAFEMQETVEILLNGINIDVRAYLVPHLASPRFLSMDDINRSYSKEARPGQPVVPWVELAAAGAYGTNPIHDYLGKHAKPTDQVNMAYVEAYNLIYNHRATEVSPNIPQRNRLDKTLAQAFWSVNNFQHVVPDFDAAVMEGEVSLNVAQAKMPVRGLMSGATVQTGDQYSADTNTLIPANSQHRTVALKQSDAAPRIYAELAENGITVSLANIDMARKAQWFADIRKRYNGLSEDMLIDLLMDGIEIPEQGWKQPILLHHGHVQMNMAKRYASNGDALTESVVNGTAGLEFRFATPSVPCGGVIMLIAEVSPEQMFERQEDPFLHAKDVDDFPHYIRDELDPQKVEVVPNRYIDIDHDTPDDTYGYAPLNYRWNAAGPNIGGRFLRPQVDAPFDEDRQALWAVETQNPTLTADAYLVPADIHLKPFVTDLIDPFDVIVLGDAAITGNTVFGNVLIEATEGSDYDKILEHVDQGRIEKD